MKLPALTLICASFLTSPLYAADNQPLASEQDKISYAIGVDIGNNFKSQGIEVNPSQFLQGLQDAVANKPLLISPEDIQKTLQDFQGQLQAKKQQQLLQQAEENKQVGDKFLAENKTKPGIITLASGLQYKVVQAGSGSKPGDKDTVAVEYTGRLLNGQVFDSSAEHGGKVSFQVDEVIAGWQAALKLMPVGSTWELYIPANLAYGERGTGHLIGPNETLIFNLHLLEVNSVKEQEKTATLTK
jgi:FKBP-type peptidyl-prolyl cis-trans isomerase FklB